MNTAAAPINREQQIALLNEEELLNQELQRRNDARESLVEYIRYNNPYAEFPDFQLVLADHLERVERGEIKRLIINMPPRFGKSFVTSHYFPAWYICRNPNRKIIHASYSANIAIDFGREIRNILKSEENGQLFNVRLRQDSKAASRFHSTNGGTYYAAGFNGSITGRGAHLLLIEDPHNAKDRNNRNRLAKVHSDFKGVLRSRLEPGAAIIIIQQRLNKHDLSGELISEMEAGGVKWTVLNMPAIDEQGKSLWPERWPVSELMEIKGSNTPADWEAQYQQKPRDAEGDVFKLEWFTDKYVDAAPEREIIQRVRFWDPAATVPKAGQDPDYTVGLLLGMTRDKRYYVMHVVRFRKSPHQNEVETLRIAELDGKRCDIVREEEGGSSGKTVNEHYKRNVLQMYNFTGKKPPASKKDRAKPVAGQCENGNVYIVRGVWNHAFIDELCSFPTGDHDDQVDALSGAFNWLNEKPRILDRLGKR